MPTITRMCQALATSDAKVTAARSGDATAAKVGHEVAQSNLDTFLTPSSMAAKLRPDLTPPAAADIYTGAHPSMLCSSCTPHFAAESVPRILLLPSSTTHCLGRSFAP